MKFLILFLCFAALGVRCDAEEATITSISPAQMKNPGENVTLDCYIVKPSDINASWLKDNVMLTLGDISVNPRNTRIRIKFDEATNKYSLQIMNLTASDTGKYKCHINLDLGKVVSREVDLQVTRAPVILDSMETNIRVAEGQTATLLCKADGYPKPEIVWTRKGDGNEIFFSKGNVFSGANMTIPQVKKEDRGIYVCGASNSIGEQVSKSVLLEVSFGPICSVKRPKTGQMEGYPADLVCKVQAYPPAAISWVRDDKEINNNELYEISYLGNGNEETISTLRLKSVENQHYGIYVCKAKNPFGSSSTELELFEQDFANDFFPLIRSSQSRIDGRVFATFGAIFLLFV